MKALIIIASNWFQDWEFYYPKTVLEYSWFEITIVSSRKWECISKLGEVTAYADEILDEVKGDDYDIVVFVGWPWVVNEFDNDMNYIRIFEEAIKNKIVGAICITPTVLSKSKLFQWRKVTWFDWWTWEQIQIIKNNWWIFTWEDVQVDWNFITANWPDVSKKFINKILEIYES